MITAIERTVNGTPLPIEQYEWKIAVGIGGFSIVDRNDGAPDGPFPGTMKLPQEAVDRIKCEGQYSGDPNCVEQHFKLWAKGTLIDVQEIRRKIAAGAWVTLPNAGPNRKFYDPNVENCIDMMFADRPPPDLGNMGPPQYCLGRCGSPLIVNTGW